jgi:hypothetical protein
MEYITKYRVQQSAILHFSFHSAFGYYNASLFYHAGNRDLRAAYKVLVLNLSIKLGLTLLVKYTRHLPHYIVSQTIQNLFMITSTKPVYVGFYYFFVTLGYNGALINCTELFLSVA